ncbi:MAG: hypothetical protein ABIK09_10315 [Pseudomonadota bacterium]
MPRVHTALPLSVEITRERGRLSLSAPVDLGPVRVGALEVSIPRLRLPADLRGGANAFHAHRTELDRIRLTVSGTDLLAAAHAAGETRLRRLDLREDTAVVMVAEEGHALVARWRILPGPDGEIILAPLETLLVGFTRRPWHLLAEELLERIGARLGARREPDGHRLRVLPSVLDHLFLTAGWRVPVARLDVAALGTRSGKLSIEYAPADAVDAVRREVGEGDEATDEIDRELLQRLDAARLHQDVDEAIRDGDSAAALTTLYRARKEGEEWDSFLQERLVVLQSCEPGLHDEALAEADRMIERGEGEVLARSCRLSVASHRRDGAAMADAGYDLAAALVARGRRGAAAFVLEQVARRLDDAGGLRGAILDRATALLPRDPGILATRAALLGSGVPLQELLASLPFMASGVERSVLLHAASRRMISDGDLSGMLALWDSAGRDLSLPADLYSLAAVAASAEDAGIRRRLLSWLLGGQVQGSPTPEGAEALVAAALEVLSVDHLEDLAEALAPVLHAGADAATRLLATLEGSITPERLLALRRRMVTGVDVTPAWRNLEFRTLARAGEVEAAWGVLNGGDVPVSPDDGTLQVIVTLMGDEGSRPRALSEMVRWVERSPDRRRRAAVAGHLGRVLQDGLGLWEDAVRYLSLAWQLDEEPGRWFPPLEKALEAAGRHEELVDLLEGTLSQTGLPPHEEGQAHLRLGRILGRRLGRWQDAAEHLRRARVLLPGAAGPERELEEALMRHAEAPPAPRVTPPALAPVATRPARSSQLDLACQEAFDLADAGEVDAARAVIESVLADDPLHGPARDLKELLGDA